MSTILLQNTTSAFSKDILGKFWLTVTALASRSKFGTWLFKWLCGMCKVTLRLLIIININCWFGQIVKTTNCWCLKTKQNIYFMFGDVFVLKNKNTKKNAFYYRHSCHLFITAVFEMKQGESFPFNFYSSSYSKENLWD